VEIAPGDEETAQGVEEIIPGDEIAAKAVKMPLYGYLETRSTRLC